MSVAALVLGHTGSVRGLKGGVQKLLTELREKNERLEESPVVQRLREEESPSLPGVRGKVVVYVTSMQAVRETFEQCQSVIQILRAHQVAFVAKDIYLHPDYNGELQLRLSDEKISVPHLYIDGEYVGGSEVVEELNECGELASMLKGFERRKASFVCLLCQGQGFVVCLWCKGTKKGMKTSFGDLKCTVCNQNALQKCPECSL